MAENKKRVSIGLTDKQYELVQKLAKEKGCVDLGGCRNIKEKDSRDFF
ncbi:hypothetical protein ACE5SX_17890 [Lactiplantibacillus plantarum]